MGWARVIPLLLDMLYALWQAWEKRKAAKQETKGNVEEAKAIRTRLADADRRRRLRERFRQQRKDDVVRDVSANSDGRPDA